MEELQSAAVGAITSDLSSNYGHDHASGRTKRSAQDVCALFFGCYYY